MANLTVSRANPVYQRLANSVQPRTLAAAPVSTNRTPARQTDQAEIHSAETRANTAVNFVSQSPDLATIRQGAILEEGSEGDSVKKMQEMLSKAGFGVQTTGIFGPTTRKQLEAFQQSAGIERNGKLGPTTLKALEASQNGPTALGRKLAASARAVARSRNSVGRCYAAVATAMDRVLPSFLSGGHAYMAASQLAAHPRFKEIPSPKNMSSLPEGAVVVWGKGSSRSGHISVALGKGQEASDHIAPQMQSHYGGARARVFLPQ